MCYMQEDQDQVKRERDRFSSQLETMTQECNDARETATRREQKLQADCDVKLQKCASLRGDLDSCRNSLRGASSDNTQCNQEVTSVLVVVVVVSP